MTEAARNLNKIIDGTTAIKLLSDYGKRMYFPNGIPAQSNEAKQKAKKFNSTAGVALKDGKSMYVSSMREGFSSSLTPEQIFLYAPMGGLPELRKMWKEEMVEKNPLLKDVPTSVPLICAGLTNALSVVFSLFADKNNSVVLPDQYWENYDLIIREQRQARKICFEMFKNGVFNVKGFDEALGKAGKKAIVLLNFPNNPTGYTPTEEEANEIACIVKKHASKGQKILTISDDAYFGLFFDNAVAKQSLFAKFANLHENVLAVKCDASTKETMVWGFRIAFITYASKGLSQDQLNVLEKKTTGAIRGCVSCCNTACQNILINGMKDSNYVKEKKDGVNVIKSRYEKLIKILEKYKENTSLVPYPCNSGYFMSFKTKCDAEQLRMKLLDVYECGIIRINEHQIRITFSSVDEELLEDFIAVLYKAAGEMA